jgi:hypothetical protein
MNFWQLFSWLPSFVPDFVIYLNSIYLLNYAVLVSSSPVRIDRANVLWQSFPNNNFLTFRSVTSYPAARPQRTTCTHPRTTDIATVATLPRLRRRARRRRSTFPRPARRTRPSATTLPPGCTTLLPCPAPRRPVQTSSWSPSMPVW